MTALAITALVLSLMSMALHLIAPKTKTTADDKALEVIDALKDGLPKDAPKA